MLSKAVEFVKNILAVDIDRAKPRLKGHGWRELHRVRLHWSLR
jgi:hypothetical protein